MGEPVTVTAAQAADLLGVRVTTVYAYVSRGVLHRTSVVHDGQRVSLFVRDEVVALAAERSRPRAGLIATMVESDVTQLDPRGRLAFRGRDIDELVGLPFETAANLLWQVGEPSAPWARPPAVMARAVAGLMPSLAAVPHGPDRIRLSVQLAAVHDPRRAELAAAHVVETARTAIRIAVDSLRPADHDEDVGVVTRLWRALAGRDGRPHDLAALNAALVVMMDHELAAATLAARVAAGTHADPWMSLLAGLAALSGPRHAGAGAAAERALDRWLAVGETPSGHPPGFGHMVYEGMDPRAVALFEYLEERDEQLMRQVDRLIARVAAEKSVLPNADLALAALCRWARFAPGSAETIFMLSRIAGLAAHTNEEYPQGFRFRARAAAAGHARGADAEAR